MIDRDFADQLVALRRQLHAEPETGLTLPRTQEKVLAALDQDMAAPVEVRLGHSCTSVVAVVQGARPGPTVLLRADMDALPLNEAADLPYRSTDPMAMHACGHDLHTAMLVGATRLLTAQRERLAGSVICMFQPGEEGFDGAGRMIDDGVLDATGQRPVAAYALHVMSAIWPRGVFATRPGPMMAAADGVYVTVHGEGGHGSAPHLARDPIPAACEMVTALQTVVARRVDPSRAAVVTVGQFHAGTKRTIIPDQARFEVTVRTIDRDTQQLVRSAIVDICEHIAQAHGLRASVEYKNEFGLTFNSPGETAFAQSVVTELFGPDRTVPMAAPSMGSEDFSRVLDAVPGAMVFLGACPPDLDPARAPYNHAPTATFDDAVLSDGAHLYAELATRTLAAAAPAA